MIINPYIFGASYLPMTQGMKDVGLTDVPTLEILNTFEQGLIDNSLTSIFKALYLFVGGNSTLHSYNFIDTSLYQLTFFGGWTHSSTGSKPNGTNAYAGTGLLANEMSTTSVHISSYIRETLSAFPATLVGVKDTDGVVIIADNANNTYYTMNDNWGTTPGSYITDPRGLILGSRIDNTEKKLYQNGSAVSTISIGANASMPAYEFYVSALNNIPTAQYFDNKETCLVSIGDGMDNTQQSAFYTLVQALQTSLSRQV